MFTSVISVYYASLLVVLLVSWSSRSHSGCQAFSLSTSSKVSSSSATQLYASTELKTLPGSTAPFKNGFDPLRLSTVGSESTLAWFQAAELKHSRCAMLAITGYLVQSAGIHFPGMLSSEISFDSISTTYASPFDQWAAVPDAGKYQIIGLIFLTEIATEAKKPHYMMNGALPTMVFPAIDFSKVDTATVQIKRSRELNNGRLAMIAIMAYISEYCIPGSVPILVQ